MHSSLQLIQSPWWPWSVGVGLRSAGLLFQTELWLSCGPVAGPSQQVSGRCGRAGTLAARYTQPSSGFYCLLNDQAYIAWPGAMFLLCWSYRAMITCICLIWNNVKQNESQKYWPTVVVDSCCCAARCSWGAAQAPCPAPSAAHNPTLRNYFAFVTLSSRKGRPQAFGDMANVWRRFTLAGCWLNYFPSIITTRHLHLAGGWGWGLRMRGPDTCLGRVPTG